MPKEVIRFSLTADTGCNADRETNSDDSKMISVEVDVGKTILISCEHSLIANLPLTIFLRISSIF